MIYLYPHNNTFSIFYEKPNLPNIIAIDQLPEGSGILRRAADETFYYEPFPEVSNPPIIEPEKPESPETLEERITRLESIIEQNNLITVDAVLGVYEELVALREEIAASKGTTDNA